MICTNTGCNDQTEEGQHRCPTCIVFDYKGKRPSAEEQQKAADASRDIQELDSGIVTITLGRRAEDTPMSEKYPKYYKRLPEGVTEADTYLVNKLFPVADDSGCIIHARKKLLVPGSRTGGKSFYEDIKEARDTLTRWMELHPELAPKKKDDPFLHGTGTK